MHRSFIIFLAAALLNAVFVPGIQAQAYKARIEENPERASGEYHYYEYSPSRRTPAPRGFKPFYISHYGRHGSRYHSSSRYFMPAFAALDTCRAEGLLTDEGEMLLRQMDTLFGEHQGMFGMLTERGAAEQRGIGGRMAELYPEVFKKRKEVEAVSSYWPRCLVSMANFASSLQRGSKRLQIRYLTGPKYLDYISMNLDTDAVIERSNEFGARLEAGRVPWERFFSALFKDPVRARTLIDDPEAFMRSVYDAGAIGPNTESRPGIFRHFTPDELAGEWILRNDKMYYRYGISAEEGEYVSAIAAPLIADIVAKADEAVRPGSRRAADLRFGHDVGLLPLVGVLGIRGMERRHNSAGVHNHWFAFDMIPMASNLQLIFCRNRRRDILVKLVYNERETSLPTLGEGPWYDWRDLRAFLVRTAEKIPGERIVRDSSRKERTGVY